MNMLRLMSAAVFQQLPTHCNYICKNYYVLTDVCKEIRVRADVLKHKGRRLPRRRFNCGYSESVSLLETILKYMTHANIRYVCSCMYMFRPFYIMHIYTQSFFIYTCSVLMCVQKKKLKQTSLEYEVNDYQLIS